MPAPSVSVIIPVFDGERFLAAAIESVISQRHEPLEIIIVDDGSTDRTAEIAAGYAEVRLLRQRNQGPPAARNAGIRTSTGELITFLDADDLMAPGRIEAQLAYLASHPEAGGVLGRQELIVEDGAALPGWVRTLGLVERPDVESSTKSWYREVFPPMSLMARRSVFERVGLFDPSFRVSDDVDWLFRAFESGIEVGTIDQVVLLRRIHGANMTYDVAECRLAMFRVFKARIDRRRSRLSYPTLSG